MGNLQKLVFFHTQKELFHTLKNNFILKCFFWTFKVCFIPWKLLYNNFIPCENFFCYMLCFHFIPSTSISYPEHGISYQVAKFSYPTQPISYSSSHFPLFSLPDSIVCIHSFTTERISHVCRCFLWPNYVAQSSSAPMAVTGTNCTHMTGIGFHTLFVTLCTQHRYENSAKGIKTAHLGMKWRPRVWNKSMTVWKIWQMLWKYDMSINVCFIVIWVCFVPLSTVAHFFCICFMVYSRFVLFSCLLVY